LQHGLKENQLIFVPHAIDNDRFSNETPDQAEYRGQLMRSIGLDEDTNAFLFAGKFQAKKNVSLLLEAFNQMAFPSWKLLLVGNGEKEEELKKQAQGNPNVYFLPFQNQRMIPAVYRLGKIFCLPSQGHDETWGLAVNEAMASGRVVIVSNEVGCAPDLVEDGVNGYVFESRNMLDLQAKMRIAVIQDLTAMGNQSKLKIENWRFGIQANQIERLLSEIE
jgi:glycosyltransferase involved in cell wall biosynthesis